MITEQANYLSFLGTPKTQMLIPVFQRVYTWGTWQCDGLWDDICRAGRAGGTHFIGSIIYNKEEAPQTSGLEQVYDIVDGQQRTTTITLLLIALRDYLAKTGKTVSGHTANDLTGRFLTVATTGGKLDKFVPTPLDQETFSAILNGKELPEDKRCAKHVLDNYRFFEDKMTQSDFDAEVVWKGLENLFAIIVSLEGDDNPQLIFEGINSKGMSLATSDLLRNKLFFGTDEVEQERLLETYWEPIEELFAYNENQMHFNAAIRAWLVSKDESLEKYSRHELYSVFRRYINEEYTGSTEELMSELLEWCTLFKKQIRSPKMKKHLDWADDAPILAGSRVATGIKGGMFP